MFAGSDNVEQPDLAHLPNSAQPWTHLNFAATDASLTDTCV